MQRALVRSARPAATAEEAAMGTEAAAVAGAAEAPEAECPAQTEISHGAPPSFRQG